MRRGGREFAPEKFEDSFVRLLDRIVAFDNVIRGASGKDFGIARVGDVVDVGDANVGDDEAVFGDGGPEERGESLAGRIAAAVVGILAGGVHVDGFFANEKRVDAVEEILPSRPSAVTRTILRV